VTESARAAPVAGNGSERLSLATKLAYGAGDMGPAMTANALAFYLLYFLTQVAGLPPGLAGSVLAIGRVWDAINDPAIGLLSDRTRLRWGRRLPWMLFGAVPFGLLFFAQWLVPRFSDSDPLNTWALFGYYVLIGILFQLGYTAVNLPYTALTPELTQDYNERTSLTSFRFAFSLGGSILALVLASMIFAAYPQDSQQQYRVWGAAIALLAVVPLLWCVLGVRERGRPALLARSQQRQLGGGLIAASLGLLAYGIAQGLGWVPPPVAARPVSLTVTALLAALLLPFGLTLRWGQREANLQAAPPASSERQPELGWRAQLRIAIGNRPFRYIVGIYLCAWLAVQLTAAVLPYFVVSWLGLPEAAFPRVALAVQGSAIVMLFVWQAASQRLEKQTVFLLGAGVWVGVQAGLFALQPAQVAGAYALAVLAGIGIAVAYLIPWSMLPDAIDLDELQTGQRREGLFYAFLVVLQKLGLALALLLVGQGLDWAGFVESQAGEPAPQQPASALLAIRIAIAPLPAVFLLAAMGLAYRYPLDRARHRAIRRQLQQRAAGTEPPSA